MYYKVEYLSDPNSIQLRLMCCLGEQRVVMKSAEEVTQDVHYNFVFREWFSHGITEISLYQHFGFLVVTLKKSIEKTWDEMLLELMAPRKSWEELPPRITDPYKVWPYHRVW